MKVYPHSYDSFPAEVEIVVKEAITSPEYEGLLAINQATVQLTIQKSEPEFYCQGKVTAKASLECCRCLEPFSAELVNKLDFIICDQDHFDALSKEAVDTEDYVFINGVDQSADITESVRQSLILAVGMKPLCDEDCKGICNSCGTNLNKQSCDCKQTNIDPRWEGLSGLSGR